VEPVFQAFRGRFRGKCSPAALLLGRVRPGGFAFQRAARAARNGLLDRDTYDEEVCSGGFWPSDPWTGGTEAMFY
jgi:hypothetical protein